jgi:SAM-dependent methyltransferase
MLRRVRKLPVALLLALTLPLGCGSKEDEKKAEEVKELPKAINGSPVSAELVEFTGEGAERGMKIRVYNHDESKTAVAYMLLFRYKDAGGNLLKVKVGTPFESDTDFTSVSGSKFKAEPKKNGTFEIDGMMLAVPAEAASAEVLASSVRALAADGTTIEDWWSQENFSEWPKGE